MTTDNKNAQVLIEEDDGFETVPFVVDEEVLKRTHFIGEELDEKIQNLFEELEIISIQPIIKYDILNIYIFEVRARQNQEIILPEDLLILLSQILREEIFVNHTCVLVINGEIC